LFVLCAMRMTVWIPSCFGLSALMRHPPWAEPPSSPKVWVNALGFWRGVISQGNRKGEGKAQALRVTEHQRPGQSGSCLVFLTTTATCCSTTTITPYLACVCVFSHLVVTWACFVYRSRCAFLSDLHSCGYSDVMVLWWALVRRF
jgi:hypothetical protein